MMDALFDPTGPGSPAWRQFERACEAWQRAKACGLPFDSRINKHYKSYHNHKQSLSNHIRKQGLNLEDWLDALKRQREEIIEE